MNDTYPDFSLIYLMCFPSKTKGNLNIQSKKKKKSTQEGFKYGWIQLGVITSCVIQPVCKIAF